MKSNTISVEKDNNRSNKSKKSKSNAHNTDSTKGPGSYKNDRYIRVGVIILYFRFILTDMPYTHRCPPAHCIIFEPIAFDNITSTLPSLHLFLSLTLHYMISHLLHPHRPDHTYIIPPLTPHSSNLPHTHSPASRTHTHTHTHTCTPHSSKPEDEEEDPPPKESTTIDSATACLYFGAVAKSILDPVLHDRNGQFNTVSTGAGLRTLLWI